MRKAFIWLLGAGISLCSPLSFGQEIEVSDPEIEIKGHTLYISYKILNTTPDQVFTVELLVSDSEGNRINAVALHGDVGDRVPGGDWKQITWDLEADRMEADSDIFIKVRVTVIPPAVKAVTKPVTDLEEAPVKFEDNRYSRAALIGLSTVFPGTGLTIHKGGPHWIKGALFYGCIGGSIGLYFLAVHTYDGIIDYAGFEAKNSEYQASLQMDQASEILAYSAIAIWVTDLIWSIAGTSDMGHRTSHQRRFGIDPVFDPVSSAPLIAFTYRF